MSTVGATMVDAQRHRMFVAICRSLALPTSPVSAPLNEDRQGKLYVDWAADFLCDGGSDNADLAWQKSQFEIILQTVSELRHKLRLIDQFVANPLSYSNETKYLFHSDAMVTSVCAALSFFSEAKTTAAQMLEKGAQFSGFRHFNEFLQTMKKHFSEFPQFFEQLLKSKNERRALKHAPICIFWDNFIRQLNFWPVEISHRMPAWKTTLFEGFVLMLGQYLTLRLRGTRTTAGDEANNGKLDFLESFWTDDELLLSRFQFVAKFEETAPLRVLEESGQLSPFHEIFVAHLHKFREEGRFNITQSFLTQIVRRSLIRHCVQLDQILLIYLKEKIRDQLHFIINVTSLNSHWIREHFHGEFFDESNEVNKRGLELFSNQFWPLQILLHQQFYNKLFTVCAHLRRIQRVLIRVMDSNQPKERPRRRWPSGAIPFVTDDLKKRLSRALGAHLMGQLQQLFQLLFTHFSSLISISVSNLVKIVEKSRSNDDENTHLTDALELVQQWENALDNLLLFMEDFFCEPIDEFIQIGEVFSNFYAVSPLHRLHMSEDKPNAQNEDRLEDAEVRLLIEWSDRLRRVCLYIGHLQQHTLAKAADKHAFVSSRTAEQFPFSLSTATLIETFVKNMALPYN